MNRTAIYASRLIGEREVMRLVRSVKLRHRACFTIRRWWVGEDFLEAIGVLVDVTGGSGQEHG